MPVPVIIAILGVLGAFLLGCLSRQPEINKLKNQVKKLQKEILRLQNVLKEQSRQINELKIRYTALKSYHFIEKQRQKRINVGLLIFQYAWVEYIQLTIYRARGNDLSEQECYFFNIFDKLMNEDEVDTMEKIFIKEYISVKYPSEIEKLIPLTSQAQTALLRNVETANVH